MSLTREQRHEIMRMRMRLHEVPVDPRRDIDIDPCDGVVEFFGRRVHRGQLSSPTARKMGRNGWAKNG